MHAIKYQIKSVYISILQTYSSSELLVTGLAPGESKQIFFLKKKLLKAFV